MLVCLFWDGHVCYFQECASTLFIEQLQNGMMDVISQGLITVHVVKSPITDVLPAGKSELRQP